MMNVNHLNYTDGHNQLYCRAKHKILDIAQVPCKHCKYFTGFFQGYGIECTWPDIMTQPIKMVRDPQQELLRVSSLLDKHMI